ncbi:host attachment protein [Verrucomicrobiaceae bacterium N1E253]|uniref:Host attachment protein n=1 Tax=Oceaniferula marina TaxID=2748318 RepID=A0A851GHE5_9BACT|nr:host attachment protein [Oceaniferula marina]NWK55281.1 host attachment protein [Oceaniferula marina]
MNKLDLKKHLIALATLPETGSPILSVYMNKSTPLDEHRKNLKDWATLARHTFKGRQQSDFEDALEEVFTFMETANDRQSLVVFSRWGEYPMLLPIHLKVPVETQFHAGSLPVIFPLVELKDRFHRFVLVAMNSEAARIFEINLGEISESLLERRPELRKRLGREWTREHYQNHRKKRSGQFVKEKIAVIEQLMTKRGHNSLILAGEPRFVNRLKEQLPKHLKAKLAGEVRSGFSKNALNKVVNQSIQVFLDQENMESQDAVKRLEYALSSNGLAVVGFHAAVEALEMYCADQLILSTNLPDREREYLSRLASTQDISIETVQNNKTLEQFGGVGCLLRYLPSWDERAIKPEVHASVA